MPSSEMLSELEEKILLAVWKLKGIGKNMVMEEAVKADLAEEGAYHEWSKWIANLRRQEFLETSNLDGRTAFSLTSLGLSILRRLEEDRLQEIG